MLRRANLEILWRDQHLLALNKPAGLATIPGRGERDSVVQQLSRQLNLPLKGTADPRIRLVHRLDKATSGVLLVATTIDAQRHLSHQFQNNLVQKEYLALVHGSPPENEGEINAPLAPHPAGPKRMTVFKHGRRALTQWHVEQRFRDYTLVRVFPKTGKTHQIRVHLKHVGLPLAVDPLYNLPPPGVEPGVFLSQFKRGYRGKRDRPERPLIARLTLHAHRLTFENLDGRLVTVEAPLPGDFFAVLNMLRKYGQPRRITPAEWRPEQIDPARTFRRR